ncbi:hypothetical protein GCM10010358_80610 [Streptomyces minutiscleroticus]|uniref:Uncharacterized protein n=1 Tax=Streptomyces minutiscleroticus TaxID=68238 RepID=A0A918P2V8_9ACTN|nr:hypothetical protein [Streptomyces minutiscleroticus]GGY16872.1 hypothetical protein GCM10010358_80610 [Streptomyces minutiscleroticus]
MKTKLNDVVGRLLLAVAVTIERQVTSKAGKRRMLERRNRALRAAANCGIEAPVLAKRVGLTVTWTRKIVANPEKAAAEEVAAEKVVAEEAL